MDRVDELFAEYVISHKAGQTDPRRLVMRASGRDREDLIMLIDAYLIRSSGREWDPEAFKNSDAERLAEPLSKVLCGESGAWPVLLPGLRHRARILREDLVTKLAAGLGVAESAELVGDYYHGMEQGTVESSGVSDRVLDVLGGIFGTAADTLRQAGESLGGGETVDTNMVFARTVPALSHSSDRDEISGAGMASPSTARDQPRTVTDQEVVRLFTGGDA